jgi:V8-like Glu-specific endopeptidase
MSGATMTVIAAAAVATTAYTIYNGERAADKQNEALKQQKVAQDEAKTAAQQQQQTSEQNINKARQKSPDVAGIQQAAEAGSRDASTMLTGPMGVKKEDLSLGKSTLLGG